jgi:hypothetical protein
MIVSFWTGNGGRVGAMTMMMMMGAVAVPVIQLTVMRMMVVVMV